MPHCKKQLSESLMTCELSKGMDHFKETDFFIKDESEISSKSHNNQIPEEASFSLEIELVEQTNEGDCLKIINLENKTRAGLSSINSIVQMLKEETQVPDFALIFVFDEAKNNYLLLGLDPLTTEFPISLDFDENNKSFKTMKIKFKRAPAPLPRQKKSSVVKSGPLELLSKTKERSLEEVIKLVLEWRRLNHGFWDGSIYKRYSLDQTAQAIGVPKKTLDDYLFQLKIGKIYKFDFEAHFYEKIGVLRTFVKSFKKSTDNQKYQRLDLEFFDYFEKIVKLMSSPQEYHDSFQTASSNFCDQIYEDKQSNQILLEERELDKLPLFEDSDRFCLDFNDYQHNYLPFTNDNNYSIDMQYSGFNQRNDMFEINFLDMVDTGASAADKRLKRSAVQ